MLLKIVKENHGKFQRKKKFMTISEFLSCYSYICYCSEWQLGSVDGLRRMLCDLWSRDPSEDPVMWQPSAVRGRDNLSWGRTRSEDLLWCHVLPLHSRESGKGRYPTWLPPSTNWFMYCIRFRLSSAGLGPPRCSKWDRYLFDHLWNTNMYCTYFDHIHSNNHTIVPRDTVVNADSQFLIQIPLNHRAWCLWFEFSTVRTIGSWR